MTATTTLPVLFATGIHASRPSASAVGAGGLYSCTTHSLVYQTDGSSWSTWATLGSTGAGTLSTVEEVDTSPTDSAVTKLVFPNGTLGIVGHVATYTPASSGAPTTSTYITTTADAGLSAEVPRPELDDFSISGATPLDFTSPTSDDASLTFLTDQTGVAKVIQCTETSTRRHAYISSAIGTGNFDLRMRVICLDITVPHTSASVPFMGFFVADSSLTAGTRLSLQVGNEEGSSADLARIQAIAVDGTGGVGTSIFGHKLPIIMRMTRSSTTITRYVSSNEGRSWSQLGSTTTSALNVGRIGLLMLGGSTGTQTSVAIVHWLRSF